MSISNDSISQVYTYIIIFKEEYNKLPTRAIVNDDSFSLLRGNNMIILNPNATNEESYTRYVLNNENKILSLQIHYLEKLPKKEKLILEERVKKEGLECPIIFANKKNHYVFGDLSLCDKELTELKEDAETNQ